MRTLQIEKHKRRKLPKRKRSLGPQPTRRTVGKGREKAPKKQNLRDLPSMTMLTTCAPKYMPPTARTTLEHANPIVDTVLGTDCEITPPPAETHHPGQNINLSGHMFAKALSFQKI